MALAVGCSCRVPTYLPNVLISRDQVIAGLPAPDVRRLMRALMRGPQTLRGIGAEAGLEGAALAALVAELEDAALIEPVPTEHGGQPWRATRSRRRESGSRCDDPRPISLLPIC